MPHLISKSRWFSSFACLAAFAGPAGFAYGLDLSKTTPVAPVTDGQISIGQRVVKLDGKAWTLVTATKGLASVSTGSATTNADRYSGYFAATAQQKFEAGFVLTTTEVGLRLDIGNASECAMEGKVFKSMLDSTVRLPECLIINRTGGLHVNAKSAYYKAVEAWLVQEGIPQTVPVYDMMFLHAGQTGQGMVRFFIPASRFENEQAAIAWAQEIPKTFRDFLEFRQDQVSLPALP